MSEKKEEAPAEGGEKKSKKKLIIIAAVALLVGGGVPAFFLLKPKKEVKEEVHVEVPPLLKRAKLDQFVVNLSQSGNFLRTIVVLEYDSNLLHEIEKKEAEHHAEGGAHGSGGGGEAPDAVPPYISLREPIVRDAIIRVLSSKRGEEVLTSVGKEQLKEELVEGINDSLAAEEPIVVAVYFAEFIVQ
jgi:flagellar protein FliL